jgi:hypothetical protein
VTEGGQPCPPSSCHNAFRQAAEDVDKCLSALAALHRAFGDLRQCAQREAITTAREQEWPLRRIAAALNCSHEHVRLVIAAGDPRGAAR